MAFYFCCRSCTAKWYADFRMDAGCEHCGSLDLVVAEATAPWLDPTPSDNGKLSVPISPSQEHRDLPPSPGEQVQPRTVQVLNSIPDNVERRLQALEDNLAKLATALAERRELDAAFEDLYTRYKALLDQATEKNLILPLYRVAAELREEARSRRKRLESVPAQPDNDALRVARECFTAFEARLDTLLNQWALRRVSAPGQVLSRFQEVLSVTETHDPALHGRIAQRMRPAYVTRDGQLVVPELVVLYRWKGHTNG